MITVTINGVDLTFKTDKSIFSPNCIDKGTLAMLSAAEFLQDDKLLDLGCGYGFVGIYAAKLIGESNVIMSDSDINCVNISAENAKLNNVGGIQTIHSTGFENITNNDFSIILSNPPYHSDFSVPKHFIEKGFNRLKTGGRMYLVTKRKEWYKKKLTAIFGGVKIYEKDGYFIFCSEKRTTQYANKK